MGGAHNFRKAVTIYITFAFEKNQHRLIKGMYISIS